MSRRLVVGWGVGCHTRMGRGRTIWQFSIFSLFQMFSEGGLYLFRRRISIFVVLQNLFMHYLWGDFHLIYEICMSSSCINVILQVMVLSCSGDIVTTNLNGGCVREQMVEAVHTLGSWDKTEPIRLELCSSVHEGSKDKQWLTWVWNC